MQQKIAVLALFVSMTVCSLLGCSSEPYMLPDSTDGSNADGAAFGGDIFYRKPMTDHSKDKKFEFYYKHCDIDDDGRPFVSKRTYACSDAY